ncbi:MAG: helix-turn-helix domain-containing protein [Alicyclobacillus shizuokensis]|nr:helix-turn-helix domain-containing protein [Alicyclobacillus shizuokensis]
MMREIPAAEHPFPLRGRDRLHLNLRQIVHDLADAPSQAQLLRTLLKTVHQVFHSDVTLVYLTEVSGQTVVPHAEDASEIADCGPLPLSALSQRVMEAPYHWPSAEIDPIVGACALCRQLSELGLKTWFSLPIRRRGVLLGIMVVGYYHHEYLVEDVVQVLWEFAHDVADLMARHLPDPLRRRVETAPDQPEVPTLYQQRRMRRLLMSHFQLTNTLWTDDNLAAIARTLSGLLRQPVMVMDEYLGVLCVAPEDGHWARPLRRLRRWVEQHPVLRQHHPFPVRTDKLGDSSFVLAPVQMGTTPLGWLVVWEQVGKLDDLDIVSLQQASTLLAVHFYRRGLGIERRAERFQELFNLLIDAPEAFGPAQEHEARLLSFNPNAPQYVMVVHLQQPEPASLVDALRLRLAAEYPEVLMARRQSDLILLLPCNRFLNEEDTQRFARWLTHTLHTVASLTPHPSTINRTEEKTADQAEEQPASRQTPSPPPALGIGISGRCSSRAELMEGFAAAHLACRLAPVYSPPDALLHAEEVLTERVLQPIAASDTAQQFIRERLDPLRRYDADHESDLLHTLCAYLEHNGNVSETAQTLYIHRTTLQYRLRRIEQLLGCSLDSGRMRFELQLALTLDQLRGCT